MSNVDAFSKQSNGMSVSEGKIPQRTASQSVEESIIEYVSLYDLIGQFNMIFHDTAKAVLTREQVSITIGNRTMHIQLPIVKGAEATLLSD